MKRTRYPEDAVDERRPDNHASILAQRDAAMISLIAHSQTLVTRLAMLTQVEKEAVLALVVIGQSLAEYEHAIQPDHDVIGSFGHTLEGLSPGSARRVMPYSHCCASQAPFCTAAHTVAEDLPDNWSRHDPGADSAAEANGEIVCHTLNLKALHAALVPSLRRPQKATGATVSGNAKSLSE